MHYILCSDNRITYTLIINDNSCKCRLARYLDVHEGARVEECGVKVGQSEPTPITRGLTHSVWEAN
jgi:hypothetical protein